VHVHNLRYQACNKHAPYCIVTSVLSGCTIFYTHYFINGAIFGKIVSEGKRHALIFSTIMYKVMYKIMYKLRINIKLPIKLCIN